MQITALTAPDLIRICLTSISVTTVENASRFSFEHANRYLRRHARVIKYTRRLG
jgi:hypothetical protein